MYRARLVASDREQQDDASTSAVHGRWAHDVGKPEKGCLLLAHPLMFGNAQPYFSQVPYPHWNMPMQMHASQLVHV